MLPLLPLHCVPEQQVKDDEKSSEDSVGLEGHHQE
jgi:hypothetical protein